MFLGVSQIIKSKCYLQIRVPTSPEIRDILNIEVFGFSHNKIGSYLFELKQNNTMEL